MWDDIGHQFGNKICKLSEVITYPTDRLPSQQRYLRIRSSSQRVRRRTRIWVSSSKRFLSRSSKSIVTCTSVRLVMTSQTSMRQMTLTRMRSSSSQRTSSSWRCRSVAQRQRQWRIEGRCGRTGNKSAFHLVPNAVGSDEVTRQNSTLDMEWWDHQGSEQGCVFDCWWKRVLSSSQINAFVLGKMKETAEAHQRSVQETPVTILVYLRDAQEQTFKDVGDYLRFVDSAYHQRNDSYCIHFRHWQQRQWQDGGESSRRVDSVRRRGWQHDPSHRGLTAIVLARGNTRTLSVLCPRE